MGARRYTWYRRVRLAAALAELIGPMPASGSGTSKMVPEGARIAIILRLV